MPSTSTAQKQSQVTEQQSLVLLKNMIRISVSSICFMRDLFPKECFKTTPYGPIEIRQLHCAEKASNGEIIVLQEEAFKLTQWLERGVFAALQEKYLHSLLFAVYSKHPRTGADLLLESYEFKMQYQNDSPASVNGAQLPSKESLKALAAKFIRSLTEFASTLDEIPSERWITLQLQYEDSTPTDYEPEYFKPAEGSLLATATLPLKVRIGSINTGHHEMQTRFAGLESLLEKDLMVIGSDMPMPLPTPSGFTATSFAEEKHSITNLSSQAANENHAAKNITLQPQDRNDTTTTIGNHQNAASMPSSSSSDEQLVASSQDSWQDSQSPTAPIRAPATHPHSAAAADQEFSERIKSLVISTRSASILACSEALGATRESVKTAFEQLKENGILRMRGNRYVLVDDSTAAAPLMLAPTRLPAPSPKPPVAPTIAPTRPCSGQGNKFAMDALASAAAAVSPATVLLPAFGEEDVLSKGKSAAVSNSAAAIATTTAAATSTPIEEAETCLEDNEPTFIDGKGVDSGILPESPVNKRVGTQKRKQPEEEEPWIDSQPENAPLSLSQTSQTSETSDTSGPTGRRKVRKTSITRDSLNVSRSVFLR